MNKRKVEKKDNFALAKDMRSLFLNDRSDVLTQRTKDNQEAV